MAGLSFNIVSAQAPLRSSELLPLPRLYYEHSSGWLPLPYWGQFFLEVGARLARYPIRPCRCVLGLAVPTKAYAAALTATGVATSLALASRFTPADEADHAERLRHLRQGTPLIYRKGNKYTKGVFDRWYVENSVQYVRLRTGRFGNEAISIPQGLLLGVDILRNAAFKLPRRQTMRDIVSNKELNFLSSCLGDRLAHEIIAYSRLDCLIIGSKEQLRREACDTRLAIKSTRSHLIEGSLNMLARTRELLGDSSAHRSAVYSSASSNQVFMDKPPTVVIFNGATGFLRCRDLWRSSHWIVLLDRTEPRFQEAVEVLNQEYMQRADEVPSESLPVLPKGIEAIWYNEAF